MVPYQTGVVLGVIAVLASVISAATAEGAAELSKCGWKNSSKASNSKSLIAHTKAEKYDEVARLAVIWPMGRPMPV